MKEGIICLLSIVLIFMGVAIHKRNVEIKALEKAAEIRSSPYYDEFVYIDQLGCLHTNKACYNLFDNYAVKMVEKTDTTLRDQYEYVCIQCYNPADMEVPKGHIFGKK